MRVRAMRRADVYMRAELVISIGSEVVLLELLEPWRWICEYIGIILYDHSRSLEPSHRRSLRWERSLTRITRIIGTEVVPVVRIRRRRVTEWSEDWTYGSRLLLCTSYSVLRCDESSYIELHLWDIPCTTLGIRSYCREYLVP